MTSYARASGGAYGDRARTGRAESVLTRAHSANHLPAETATTSTVTQIYGGTNRVQRMVMARQLLKE